MLNNIAMNNEFIVVGNSISRNQPGRCSKEFARVLGHEVNRGKYNSNAKRDFVQHILLTRKMELHFQ